MGNLLNRHWESIDRVFTIGSYITLLVFITSVSHLIYSREGVFETQKEYFEKICYKKNLFEQISGLKVGSSFGIIQLRFACVNEKISQGTSYLNTNIDVSDCFFERTLTFSGSGGVISINGQYYMNISFSMFSKCSCSAQGGAIFFRNGKDTKLKAICGYQCSASSTPAGHFIFEDITTVSKTIEYLSVSNCPNPSFSKPEGILVFFGQFVKIDNTNSSMNTAIQTPGIYFNNVNTFSCAYCTFSNNKATNSICIAFLFVTGSMMSSNIVNNNSPLQYGVFYLYYGNPQIKYCVLADNANTLFSIEGCTPTIAHCFIYNCGGLASIGTNNSFIQIDTYGIAFFKSHYCYAENPFSIETPINTIMDTPINTFEETPMNTFEETPMSTFEETPMSTFEETPINTFGETLINTFGETPMNTFEETPINTFGETPMSTFEETPMNTFEETPMSTFEETPINTFGETLINTFGETPMNTFEETPINTFGETPMSTFEETPINTFEETPMNTFEETPMNTFEETPINTFEETPINTFGETPMNTFEETPMNTFEETPMNTFEETPMNTFEETPMNTFEETPMNTFEETPINTFEETPMNTFGETLINTFGETLINTFGETPMNTFDETLMRTFKDTPIKTVEETHIKTIDETKIKTFEETIIGTNEDSVINTLDATLMYSNIDTIFYTDMNTINQTIDSTNSSSSTTILIVIGSSTSAVSIPLLIHWFNKRMHSSQIEPGLDFSDDS